MPAGAWRVRHSMDEETEIQVRSLDGAQTAVRISQDCTVDDLKVLLKETFPPAGRATDFQLFYMGDRLSVGSRVCDHHIARGGFLVLVPFAKRARCCQVSRSPGGGSSNQTEASKCADAAWSDLMEDLRSLPETADDLQARGTYAAQSIDSRPRKQEASTSRDTRKGCLKIKSRGREADIDFLRNLLGNRKRTSYFRSSCRRSSRVLSPRTCLSDPRTEKCVFLVEYSECSLEGGRCVCPAWLKRLVKCFSFLNVAHGFLVMQHRVIEWRYLKEVLGQSSNSDNEDFSTIDVEHLLAFCPKRTDALNAAECGMKTILMNQAYVIKGERPLKQETPCLTPLPATMETILFYSADHHGRARKKGHMDAIMDPAGLTRQIHGLKQIALGAELLVRLGGSAPGAVRC